MQYSNTFRLRAGPLPNPFLLVATLLLTCQLGIAQANDLLGADMGLPSSAPDNSLIDTDTIAPSAPQPNVTPAEAADMVRKKVGGQVMSVNTQHDDTRVIYGVKVLNAGRMRIINVDGQTGQLLNQ